MPMSRFLASTSVTAGTLSHEKLRKSPFFAECDGSFLTRLIKDLSVELFTANEIIVEQGDHAEKMYYLMMGEVEVLVGHDRVRVAKLQEGTVFGEMAMFNHLGNSFARRSATIRAVGFCDTRVINTDRFHAILKSHPKERVRFEKIAQERKVKLEKSKAFLRPETQIRPTAQSTDGASQAVKLKALLGRRASLPVDWANVRSRDLQENAHEMKDEQSWGPRPVVSAVNSSSFTMSLATTLDPLGTHRVLAVPEGPQVLAENDSSSSSDSSSDSGLDIEDDKPPSSARRPSRSQSPVVQCPEGRRPRVASLLSAVREVASPTPSEKATGRQLPKRRRRRRSGTLSPLIELHDQKPHLPKAITRLEGWKAVLVTQERTEPPFERKSCLKSARSARSRRRTSRPEWTMR
ncbi:unnamed protein product [Durusdinium trenchii]|uniref:Potassium/sodium hyperpolarization-activated cyclic nucleotide-gated channel 4 n=2 Tax=Durusdinium trenchii TaxID=1381693 RepID=A0ABP0QEM5_9DINO